MIQLPVPPIPDLARVSGSTVDEAVAWLLTYYNSDPVPWNYVLGTTCVKEAYRGLDNLEQLLSGCKGEKNKQGRKSNEEVVRLAAPLAFGRRMHVFDLPRRQFAFGRDLRAGYRIPFFFVENRIVVLYFLQPRKGANLTYDQICMVATVHKRFLLDTEFFGQKCDVEYVDLGADRITQERVVRRNSLSTLELWSEERLQDRLSLITEALSRVNASGLVKGKRRIIRAPHSEMPLFD